jgi:WD40 repeat protein
MWLNIFRKQIIYLFTILKNLTSIINSQGGVVLTYEEALAMVTTALAPKSLSKLQIDVFREAWNKQSYRKIALELNHEYSYIKDVGAELWQLVSEALGILVTKLNLQDTLATYYLQRSSHNLSASLQCRVGWGEAPDVAHFCGREAQLATLEQWVLQARCRLVAVIGMGGMGKTMLVTQLTQQLLETKQFEVVVWRSLHQAPPLAEFLGELLQAIAPEAFPTLQLNVLMRQLLEQLRNRRCLLILDNVESVLRGSEFVGTYLPGYEEYGSLFQQLGSGQHQSSILITSRETPAEVVTQAGSTAPVRLLRLKPLSAIEGETILATKGLLLQAEQSQIQELVEYYQGNPLALKIVATPLQDLYNNNIAAFLAEETRLFKNIRELLAQQFDRLSELEKQVMYWLAINREAVTVAQLQTDLLPSVTQARLRDALISLDQRSLIERINPISVTSTTPVRIDDTRYTQQAVVMEYVTERLIEQVCQELEQARIDCLKKHALMKAQAKDYIRDIQIRLIVQPTLARLIEVQGGSENLKHLLLELLKIQQHQAKLQPGYFAGNVINLLHQLGTELSHLDFSNLMIWQADLRMMNLQGTNFSHTDLKYSIFTQALNNILCAAFSPNGQRFATSHVNGEIYVWQIEDGQQIAAFRGDVSFAKSIAFTLDSETLVVSDRDWIVKRLHIPSGTVRGEFHGHTGAVLSVAISVDGRFLASGDEDQAIKVWDMETGVCLKTLEGQQQEWLIALAFDPTSQISDEHYILASGGGDRAIRLWDVETGQILQILKGHTQSVLAVAFSPDGRILASSSIDQTIRLWNTRTGDLIAVWPGHNAPIWTLAFSPDGQTLVSGSEDQTIKQWDIKTQHCSRTLRGHTAIVQSVAYSPDGLTLISAALNQSVRIWDARTGHCLKTWQGYSKIVFYVAFHPNGRTLASCHGDKVLRLWDVQTGDCLNCLQGHNDHISCVAFNPNGQLLASGSFDQTIRLWDVQSGNFLRTFQTQGWVTSVDFSPDGTLLVGSSTDRFVRLWDVRTGQCLRVIEPGISRVQSVAFSPLQHYLASANRDGTVQLWNFDTSQCLLTLEGHNRRTQTVTFDPIAQRLASGGDDHTVKVWDLQTGHCLQTLQGHSCAVRSICFHPHRDLLASGSLDCTLKLWDLQQGKNISTFKGHTRPVRSITFDREGRILVSGSEDGTIRLWDTDSGDCLRVLTVDAPYEGMNISGVTGLTNTQKETLRVLGAIEFVC